ncbi:hypothetical protein Sjap_006243 [Stephania japonica]|uniref:Uncharacterized protein n=1 Tax=Stephania japonica TaxID=461633 RepID=A0AAP0K833_9MAGN
MAIYELMTLLSMVFGISRVYTALPMQVIQAIQGTPIPYFNDEDVLVWQALPMGDFIPNQCVYCYTVWRLVIQLIGYGFDISNVPKSSNSCSGFYFEIAFSLRTFSGDATQSILRYTKGVKRLKDIIHLFRYCP